MTVSTSTGLPTLWVKLFKAGILGPLFDWLRMLYACMCYVVQHEGAVLEAFKSLIGVLTGDSVSPILWNLYFADIDGAIPVHADDLIFCDTTICHIEHADDVAMFSTGVVVHLSALVAESDWNHSSVTVPQLGILLSAFTLCLPTCFYS